MYSYQSQTHYTYGHEQYSTHHNKHMNDLHRSPANPTMAFKTPDVPQTAAESLPATKKKRQKKVKMPAGQLVVDTSTFSVEQRLVAAVWVHERKRTAISMSQIKKDFLQRFGRQSPAKNTLLAWERKLFSSGSIHDAPRTGRPVSRQSRMEEVSASLRAAPTLSLRARAAALRVPRTTLNTILSRDLRHIPQRRNRSPKKTIKSRKVPAAAPPRGAASAPQASQPQPYQRHGY